MYSGSSLGPNSIAMKNNTTLYHLIIDRSGSMSDCVEQTVSSFNEQVQSIAKLQKEFPNQRFLISLTTFSDEVSVVYERMDSRDIPRLRKRHSQPDGLTALNDAIGQTIQQIDLAMSEMLTRNEASVVVVVLTDGGENSSKRFSGAQISEMIKAKEHSGLWSFNFLGADFNAETVVESYGLIPKQARSFLKSNMNEAMANVSSSMRTYAQAKEKGGMKEDFFSDFKN
jgi:hypothetical protein